MALLRAVSPSSLPEKYAELVGVRVCGVTRTWSILLEETADSGHLGPSHSSLMLCHSKAYLGCILEC